MLDFEYSRKRRDNLPLQNSLIVFVVYVREFSIECFVPSYICYISWAEGTNLSLEFAKKIYPNEH